MNKKILVVCLFTMTLLLNVNSQSKFSLATEKQRVAIEEGVMKSAKGIKFLTCSFTQTKSVPALSEAVVSKGTMFYQSNDKLLWKYESPYKYEFLIVGDVATIKDGNNTTRLDVKSNKMLNYVSKIMIGLVNGSSILDRANFDITYFISKDGFCRITLMPKNKELKKMFNEISLIFTETDYTACSIELLETKGDKTDIRLTNKQINKSFNTSIFSSSK